MDKINFYVVQILHAKKVELGNNTKKTEELERRTVSGGRESIKKKELIVEG
jgi:hypothetical protein